MSEKYKIGDSKNLHFITVTIIDWVDLLTRPVYKDVIIDSLKYCQQSRSLKVYAYVIMSNHFHIIVSNDKESLSTTIRDFKKFTSKKLISTIKNINESRKVWLLRKFEYAANRVKKGVNYKVWQDGFHPVKLTTNLLMERRLNYIHNNPVEQGLVHNPEDYVYSSAADYSGSGNGLLELEFIE